MENNILNNIFEENTPIVLYCYNRLGKTEFIVNSKEDILQEGYVALWNSVLTYDDTRGSKFSSYAFPCVNNAMLKWIQKNKHSYDLDSLDVDISNNDSTEDKLTLYDIIGVEQNFESVSITIPYVIDIYKNWLKKKHKRENAINLRIERAKILLTLMIEKDDINLCKIQSDYNINRTTCSKIISEIRQCLQTEQV